MHQCSTTLRRRNDDDDRGASLSNLETTLTDTAKRLETVAPGKR
jgi:hypothetical protein